MVGDMSSGAGSRVTRPVLLFVIAAVLTACTTATETSPTTSTLAAASESGTTFADTTTTSEASTTTLATTTTTTAATTTTVALTYTGIAGVVIGEGEDFTGSTITCYGLQGDDGQAYNLAIGPDTGLQWGALVTADGERVRGGTSKEVVGADIEDIETGEAVIRAEDYVEVVVDSPPSGTSQCDLPVLGVVSIRPLD